MCGVFVLHIVGKTVVCCQTFAFVIDLHELVSDLEINLFLCVLIWAGIPVFLVYDMEVEVDSTAIDPFSNLIRNVRERPEIISLFLQYFIATAFALLKGFMIEFIELIRNVLLEFRKGIIRFISAAGDDGGSDLTDRAFYGWFLLRFPDAGRMIAVM